MKIILIFLSILILSTTMIDKSYANEKPYQYKITSGLLWKTIGKGEIEPKYKGYIGSYKNGVPYGKGTMNYYDRKKLVGLDTNINFFVLQ